jgi:hypothetical protein
VVFAERGPSTRAFVVAITSSISFEALIHIDSGDRRGEGLGKVGSGRGPQRCLVRTFFIETLRTRFPGGGRSLKPSPPHRAAPPIAVVFLNANAELFPLGYARHQEPCSTSSARHPWCCFPVVRLHIQRPQHTAYPSVPSSPTYAPLIHAPSLQVLGWYLRSIWY